MVRTHVRTRADAGPDASGRELRHCLLSSIILSIGGSVGRRMRPGGVHMDAIWVRTKLYDTVPCNTIMLCSEEKKYMLSALSSTSSTTAPTVTAATWPPTQVTEAPTGSTATPTITGATWSPSVCLYGANHDVDVLCHVTPRVI